MANQVKTDLSVIANKVLFDTQNNSVILGQMNRDYQDDLYKANPVGILNTSVDIIKAQDPTPADIFVDTVKISSYIETDVKLVLDKILDKSYSFGIREQNATPGAIERAFLLQGEAVKARMELLILDEMTEVATPLILPAASGTTFTTEDFSILEEAMINARIPAQNSVALINSATKRKMTSGTTLFAYSQNRDAKFSQGVGAQNNFSAGTGYITTEYGINFYLSDKLSSNYDYYKGLNDKGETDPNAKSTYVSDTATFNWDGGFEVLQLQFPASTASFTILRNDVLTVNGIAYRVYVKATHTAEAGNNAVKTLDVYGKANGKALFNSANVGAKVKILSASGAKFRNFLFSNKAVAIGYKAPFVEVSDQYIVQDTATGVSMRLYRDVDAKTKQLQVSVDCIFGVKALLPDQIYMFAA